MVSFKEKVYPACAKIPQGKVSTYSEIARAIGSPRACRAVGNALNKNRSPKVPCHRVVCSGGLVGGFAYGTKKKEQMLKREGVEIKDGKVVDFSRYFLRLC
jgi:methylated-DNA-[protein]-cysteine S-methyltransferase